MSWRRVWHLALGFKTLAYSTVAVWLCVLPALLWCSVSFLLALQMFLFPSSAKCWLFFFFFFNLAKLHGFQDLSSPSRDWTPHPVLTTGLPRNSFYFLNLRLKIFLLRPSFPEDLIESLSLLFSVAILFDCFLGSILNSVLHIDCFLLCNVSLLYYTLRTLSPWPPVYLCQASAHPW